MDRIPEDKREEWWHNMTQPLPGMEKKVSDADLAADGESFMALMQSQ